VLWGNTVAVVCVGIADLLVDVTFSYLSILGIVSAVKESVACHPCGEEDVPSRLGLSKYCHYDAQVSSVGGSMNA